MGGLLTCLAAVYGQAPSDSENSQEALATFKSRVNLVVVPVVVRDAGGHAIGNLHQEDFQLFDKGKLQVITKFSVEKSSAQVAREAERAAPKVDEKPGDPAPSILPERYTAYLFDDVHAEIGDLIPTRDAAIRHLADLDSTARAAIFSTSGQTNLDFTDDRIKLRDTLLRIQPRPTARSIKGLQCPDVSYYQADLIRNKNDPQALQVATKDAINCLHLTGNQVGAAQQAARSAASIALSAGDHESRLALSILSEVVRRVSAMPGQRRIILVSPGFFTPYDLVENKTDIIDRAIHANVIISSLDARGLYTFIPGGDASQQGYASNIAELKSGYDRDSATQQADVLAELAEGTGGTFFHNSNDLDAGFKRMAEVPDFVYVLGFSPETLKPDGNFHKLKIKLKDSSQLIVQARRGYYSPKRLADPAETAKQQIEDTLFSREETHDIPIELRTQAKSSEDGARLTVFVHVDLRHIQFKKQDGRNRNDLTFAFALFDRNGSYLTGNQGTIELRLLDETLEKRLAEGINVQRNFEVKPGTYLVRVVVRDAEGQTMSARSGAVEIR